MWRIHVAILALLVLLAHGCGDDLAPARSAHEEDARVQAERLREERGLQRAREERERARKEAEEAEEDARRAAAEAAKQRQEELDRERELQEAQARAREEKERMGKLVRTVFDSPDYDQAVEAAAQALQLDDTTHELGAEQRRALRALLFVKLQNAFKAATSGPLDEAVLAAWIAKKERLVMPYVPAPAELSVKGYDGSLDFAPVFVVVVAYAHCAKGDLSSCRTFAEQGRLFRRAPFKHVATKRIYEDLLAKTDRALIASDPYAPGQYLTNAGFLQVWIGRIVERRPGSIRVRLTYTLGGGPFGGQRGKVVEMRLDDVKPLTAVSADALVRGYR